MRELVFGLVFLSLAIFPAAAKTPATLQVAVEARPGALPGLLAATVHFRRAMAEGCIEFDPVAGPTSGANGPSSGNLTPRPSNKGIPASDLAPGLCLPL